jgi:hypothetical protein
MASSAKRKTTMAKLNRENKLRERRLIKQARKEARKQAPAGQLDPSVRDTEPATTDAPERGGNSTAVEAVVQPPAEVDRGSAAH